MNTIFRIAPYLLLAACTSQPLDRTEAQTNYLQVERANQEDSKLRAEHTSKALGLGSQVRALDSQIANQRGVIAHWKSMPEVPSGPAMMANARTRLKQLTAEKEDLLRRQAAELERVEDLTGEESD